MNQVKRVGKTLFVLFLCYHLASTWATLIPTGSKLRQVVQKAFWHYQCASGTQQDWSMFVAIARHRTSDSRVLFHYHADQDSIEHGPMLPNFDRFDAQRTFRHHTLMTRCWHSESPKLLEVLGQKYLQAAQRETGFPLDSLDAIELEFYFEEINPLVFMRIGGDIAFPHTLRRTLWTTEE
jgi:hypothetical protein